MWHVGQWFSNPIWMVLRVRELYCCGSWPYIFCGWPLLSLQQFGIIVCCRQFSQRRTNHTAPNSSHLRGENAQVFRGCFQLADEEETNRFTGELSLSVSLFFSLGSSNPLHKLHKMGTQPLHHGLISFPMTTWDDHKTQLKNRHFPLGLDSL